MTLEPVTASAQTVLLTAHDGDGDVFTSWTGACAGTASTCSLTMSSDQGVTASFLPGLALTVGRTSTNLGDGRVWGGGDKIDCPGSCSALYLPGTMVTLTAEANGTSVFKGWSDSAACPGTGTCTLTLDASRSLNALFEGTELTLLKAGTGTGLVEGLDDLGTSFSCGSACSHLYGYDTDLTLTLAATADADSVFDGWSGDCTSSPCPLDMTEAKAVTATFTRKPVLTIQFLGAGTGAVSGEPALTSVCAAPGPCLYSMAPGSGVDLTAAADAGSSFSEWGGACSGNLTCSLAVITADTTVTATFTTP